MCFENIVGHENIISSLKKSIKDNTISHAYLFQGEEGIGKIKLSYAFTKALLCLNEEDKPCNTCKACSLFEVSNNPDFLHIAPVKDMIRKDEIKRIQNEMKTAPINSKKKVIIIEEAHLMNKESTNKLLKTLEEPPSFVHIILTSSVPFKILPTILSRVQIINFFPVEKEKIKKLLIEEYGRSSADAKFITEFTKGIIGKSISISKDEKILKKREEVLNLIDPIIMGDKTKVFYSMSFFDDNEEDIDSILNIIIYYFRDLMVYKRLGNSPLIINSDKLDFLSKHSFMDFNKISDIILNIMKTKDIIKRNINYKLAIEAMLLNI